MDDIDDKILGFQVVNFGGHSLEDIGHDLPGVVSQPVLSEEGGKGGLYQIHEDDLDHDCDKLRDRAIEF